MHSSGYESFVGRFAAIDDLCALQTLALGHLSRKQAQSVRQIQVILQLAISDADTGAMLTAQRISFRFRYATTSSAASMATIS